MVKKSSWQRLSPFLPFLALPFFVYPPPRRGKALSKVYNAFSLRCISSQASDGCQGLRI